MFYYYFLRHPNSNFPVFHKVLFTITRYVQKI